MLNMNKKHLIFFLLMFFIFTYKASASDIEITKVNYNPPVKTDHIWVEVHNNSSLSIDLTTWSVADYDTDGKWHFHAIKAYSSKILSPDSYAIIAKSSPSTIDVFKTKNPDITGQLFYGNLTIGSEGAIALSGDGKTIVSQTDYGADGVSSDSTQTEDDTDSPTSSDSTDPTLSTSEGTTKIYKISTKIISPKIVRSLVPFTIDHQTFGIHKEKVILGRFVWNFGDGEKKEVSVSDPFPYVYQYPGDYVMTLSFYDSAFSITPDATDRINIKVIPSGVTISSVGTPLDPFVEIQNNSPYEMSLKDFIVKGSVHSFAIPNDMIILPDKKIKLSPRATGFDFNDLSYISIMDTSGQVFATYPYKVSSTYNKYNSSNKANNSNIIKSDTEESPSLADENQVINLNDLGANVVNSQDTNDISRGFYAWLGLFVVMVVGIVSIVLIRRKTEYPDYIEGEITAKDMTILE